MKRSATLRVPFVLKRCFYNRELARKPCELRGIGTLKKPPISQIRQLPDRELAGFPV